MMQSMTGFGHATRDHEQVVVSVEIRALNARQSDIRIKLPGIYREEEIGLRNQLQAVAQRGKVDVTIERKDTQGSDLDQEINQPLFKRYYDTLLKLSASSEEQDYATLAAAILRLPNVVGAAVGELEASEKEALQQAFDDAIRKFLAFRQAEGDSLATDLEAHVASIQQALSGVDAYEVERAENMRARLQKMIDDNVQAGAVDQNRFEQEVLYYLEKMDISEEKVRLTQHCKFFLEKLRDSEVAKGRRLNFISQEMGREINTLGAKAYSTDIQRCVVEMKEALEKIKEQLANVV